MNQTQSRLPAFARSLAGCSLFLSLFTFAPAAHGQWTAPTDEELKMTAQPEVPGANAVYLFREEINDDNDPSWSLYVRMKVLTTAGEKFAQVKLNQFKATEGQSSKITNIQGRTIHPDGTIIPMAQPPIDRPGVQRDAVKQTLVEFTLPSVTVGSILEYRYKVVFDGFHAYAPTWYVQSDLFTRKAHYIWMPTTSHLRTKGARGEEKITRIVAIPVLPKDAVFKEANSAGNTRDTGEMKMELKIDNVPPVPHEDYMPPIANLNYRVLFYYMAYKTTDELWQDMGFSWSKNSDDFIGPGSKVQLAVHQLTGPSDTQEQKLRKIYAAVMQVENMNYTRGFSASQDKTNGIEPPKSTDDVWEHKAGHPDQIAELFVAMARAAGMKAYLMKVPNQQRNLFIPEFLNLSQLQDAVAIVTVDGKEQFFDPGEARCPYGYLPWQHSGTSGLRQTDKGSAIAVTPAEPLTASRIQRVANLTLDAQGAVKGTVKLALTGAPALTWRQSALREANPIFQRGLADAAQQMLPAGMNVAIGGIQNIEEYEAPLIVTYDVKGPLASVAGDRMSFSGKFFEADPKPLFSQEKRETPVYLFYPRIVQDAVRIAFPPGYGLESAPAAEKLPFQKFAAYSQSADSTPTSITLRREFDLGNVYYKVEQYPDLRDFYNKLESKDQEPVVLKAASLAAAN